MGIFATLSVIQGPDKGKEIRFSSGLVSVGRFKNSDLYISNNDMGVSGKHFEVRFKKGKYYLYNYGSNGTLVNGRDVKEGLLRDGDQIGIGFSTVLQFRLEGVTEYGVKGDLDSSF
jgi:predicted component of type VI protein secretion system